MLYNTGGLCKLCVHQVVLFDSFYTMVASWGIPLMAQLERARAPRWINLKG
jgi:hypothetical protein